MSPVRTAIIGLGYWGPNVLRNFAAQGECAMVLACDRDAARRERLERQYPSVRFTADAEEIFTDASIELVLIATPTGTHAPLARRALEAGKHVFVEKPLAATVAEAEELVALAKKQKKLLFVDHTFAFAPAVEKLASLAGSQSLGDLLCFDSARLNLGLLQRDANVIEDLAVHDLSILSAIVPLETAQTVLAVGFTHFGKQIEEAHMHLTFPRGFHAHIHVSWLSPVKVRRTLLTGAKAMVLYDDAEPSEKIRVYDKGVERDAAKPDPFFPKYRSGDVVIPALATVETLSAEAQHVLRCVHGEEKPRVSGEAGLAVLRILDAANRSIASGSPVAL
ncbi:MAG: oxidoreductase domain-containing protein [Candidatus Peregrinibacteria bacterium Gr01-1014_25]|nr:MAG: oxidoreductase domain-containing protein [Candidatus Peregrinibacteria bacterium Gr01-1014_25]